MCTYCYEKIVLEMLYPHSRLTAGRDLQQVLKMGNPINCIQTALVGSHYYSHQHVFSDSPLPLQSPLSLGIKIPHVIASGQLLFAAANKTLL